MQSVVAVREPSLATRSLEEARELLTRQYCSHSILQRDRSAKLDMRYSHTALSNMSFNYLQYGAEVDIRPQEFETFYLVHIPLSGHATMRTRDREFILSKGSASIISPTHRVWTTWTADCKQLMLKIDRKAVDNFLSNLIYQPINKPVEFPSELNLSKGLGANFYNLVLYLGNELASNDSMSKYELVSGPLQQTLLTLLLTGVDHSYRDALQMAGKSICPKHVFKAYNYMVANARESITIEDLTRVAGVSGRALYEGFKRFKGAPPKACLKAIRMQGVRRELLEGQDSDDVTVIAQRWGFFHLGRFASNYQQIFGEKPSQTLRRNR